MVDETNRLLSKISAAVVEHEGDEVGGLTIDALGADIPPRSVRQALLEGLDSIRRKLMSNEASIPQFLLCLDAMNEGLANLAGQNPGEKAEIPVVIGVVEGDPHDLGESIIAGVYRSYGYTVHDLGAQVALDVFLRSVIDKKAKILALSAMMSTTMGQMQDIIKEVRQQSPETAVIIGGAPLDREIAMEYGADGFAESAVTVLEETEVALERFSERRR